MKLKTKLTGLASKTRLFFIHAPSPDNLQLAQAPKLVRGFSARLVPHRKVLGFIFALFLVVLGGFFASTVTANADYKASDISIQVDTLVNNQTNNFARVGKNGTLNIEVRLTLLAPSQLNIGSDLLDTSSWQVQNRVIDGFGAGTVPTTYTSSAGCEMTTMNNLLGTGGSQFQVCKSVGGTDVAGTSGTIKQNGYLLDKTISLNSTQLAALGVTSTSTVGQFYVYPYLIFDNVQSSSIKSTLVNNMFGLVSDFLQLKQVLLNGITVDLAYMPGKSFYVQLYDTQAQADTATASGQPPPTCSAGQTANCVPGYGSVTANSVVGSGGSALATFLAQVVNFILGLFQELIYAIFSFLIAPVIQALLSIQAYKDTFVAVIYPGWIVIRNLCDIMFIVALIVIAMATLFRLDSYQYKHLLVQLIIAALLINFSLVIGQAVLGIADTVQAQFLPANVTVIKSLAGDLMVNNWRSQFFGAGGQQIFSGSYSDVVIPFFYLALSLGSFMVFVAIAAFLFIRICALWILLMISPVAYVCGILPATEQYRKEWWTTFLKYAFFTPIMAFFLNMAAIMSNTYRTTPILQQVNDAALQASLGNSQIATFVFKVASNILLLIFLIAGLMVAEKFSIYGAKEVSGFATKYGWQAPFGGAAFLGKAGGLKVKKEYDKATSEWANKGGWRQQAFKVAHPAAFIHGLREESKKERELYKARVEAGATKVAREQKGWRRHTESPMFLFDEHKGKELYEEEEGEWSDNEQQVLGVINRLAADAKKGDLRASIKLKHSLTEAFRHKNLNEVMTGDNGLAAKFLGGKFNKYNSDNIRYFFQRMTEEGFLDENFTKEFEKKLSKDGYEIGDFNGVELVASDPKTGHPHLIRMQKKLNDKGLWTGDAVPVGWEDTKDASGTVVKKGYVTRREELIKQADKEGRKEAEDKGETDEDKIGVMIANRLGKLEEDEVAADHDYENSMNDEKSRRYMKINMSKKTGTAQLGMFHDSAINVGSRDGEVEISDAGTEIVGHMDAGKMYAMARDNMPAKTKDKFMLYIKGILKDEGKGLEKIHKDAEKIVRAKYRENGVVLTDTKKKIEVDEITNYWLGSGYEIMSSTPGATVNKEYFEKKSSETTKSLLLKAIVNYKKEGATSTPAPEEEEDD